MMILIIIFGRLDNQSEYGTCIFVSFRFPIQHFFWKQFLCNNFILCLYLPGQLGAGAIAGITIAVVLVVLIYRHLKKVAMIINNN